MKFVRDTAFALDPFHCLLRGNWFPFGATLGLEFARFYGVLGKSSQPRLWGCLFLWARA